MAPHLLLPIAIDVTVKGTVLLLLAWALTWLLRRASASARHLVWATALLALLALPLLHTALPRWHVGVALPWSEAPAPEGLAQATPPPTEDDWIVLPDARGMPTPRRNAAAGDAKDAQAGLLLASNAPPVSAPPADAPVPPATASPAAPVSFAQVAALLWLGGVGLSLVWVVLGWFSVWRLRRTSVLVRDGAIAELVRELTTHLGIRRRVAVHVSSRRAIPMTWGVLRPVILLPDEASTWPVDRLRMVLVHELGHIRRWDCLVQTLGHLARGLYWFHPLAWLALSRLRAEQEQACDDLVLQDGAAAPDYAEHLLAVTARLPLSVFSSPVALGMARGTRLQHRLENLLDGGRNHRVVRRGGVLLTILIALGLLGPLATLGLRSAAAATAEVVEPVLIDNEAPPAQVEKPTDPAKRFAEVQKKLQEMYVTPINEKRLWEEALKGLLKALEDPFTDYLPAEQFGQLEAQFKGAVSGIGAQLKIADGRLTVVTPLPDSPALKAGVRPGDFIETINGQPTRGLQMQEAIKRIVGEAGTVVKLKVVHADGVVEELNVTRGQIRIATVHGFLRDAEGRWQLMLDPEHKIGYLHLQQFGGGTARELKDAMDVLKRDGFKALILDLRFCPGGLLSQALEVGGMLLKEGTIVSTRGPNKEEKVFPADGKSWLGDFPLVLLVNEQTASSGEIVAGALRDHGRAILVGTRSYGKGSVQTLHKLEEGGYLKLTTALHYLPSGRNIQKRPGEKTWGVDPTDGYYIPLTKAQRDAVQKSMQDRGILGYKKDEQPPRPTRITPKVIEETYADPQLAAALRTMVARLTGGEFIKVGKDNALLLDHLQRLEEMRQRREALQQNLNNLDREITDLERLTGEKKK